MSGAVLLGRFEIIDVKSELETGGSEERVVEVFILDAVSLHRGDKEMVLADAIFLDGEIGRAHV